VSDYVSSSSEMLHVFISFSHEDGNFANTLKHDLSQTGFESWMDIERLLRAETWQETIDVHIRKAFVLIAILSPAASTSTCCIYEWSFASGRGIPVIPLIVKPTKLHPRLETLKRHDFSNSAIQPWSGLLEQIKQIQGTNAPIRDTEIDRGILPWLDDLYSEDPRLRLAAVNALGESRNPLAVPDLLGALGDDDRETRLAILRAIGKIADPRALPRLLYILRHHPDSQMREAAAESLGQMDDARVIPGLIAALADKNETVHHTARRALVERGDQALARLAADLQHPNWKVRQVAAQTLGEVGGITSLNALLSAIDDSDVDVRIATIRALGDIDEPSAVSSLVKSLYSEHNQRWRITGMILLSLKRIGTQEALAAVEAWRKQQKKPEHY